MEGVKCQVCSKREYQPEPIVDVSVKMAKHAKSDSNDEEEEKEELTDGKANQPFNFKLEVSSKKDIEKENKLLKMRLEAMNQELSTRKKDMDRIKTSTGHVCKGCFGTVNKVTDMKGKWNTCNKCEQLYCQKCSLFYVHSSNCCNKVFCSACSVKIIGCEEHAKKFMDSQRSLFDHLRDNNRFHLGQHAADPEVRPSSRIGPNLAFEQASRAQAPGYQQQLQQFSSNNS
jgi:hypothetical protein